MIIQFEIILSFYIILFFSNIVFDYYYKVRVNNFYLTMFLLLPFLMFSSLRTSGTDYISYLYMYETISFEYLNFPFYKSPLGTSGNEFIWATISSFFKFMGLQFPSFIFFVSLLSVSLKAFIYSKSNNSAFYVVFLFVSLIFIKELGQIRHALSISFFLLSIYLYSSKNKLYYIPLIFAPLVHPIGLIAFPFYFLSKTNFFKSKFYYILLFFSIVLFYFDGLLPSILSPLEVYGGVFEKLVGYSTRSRADIGVYFVLICLLTIFLFFNNFDNVFYHSYKYGFLLFILLFDIPNFSFRLLEMFCLSVLPFLKISQLITSFALLVGIYSFFNAELFTIL